MRMPDVIRKKLFFDIGMILIIRVSYDNDAIRCYACRCYLVEHQLRLFYRIPVRIISSILT